MFLFFISTLNISINYDNRHIKKPHTIQALEIIKEKSFNNIIALPNVVLYQNYISTVSKIKYYNLFFNFEEIRNENVNKFAVLCLYKARFAGDQDSNNYEYCNKDYIGFENFENIEIPDYKIRFFKKK